MKIIFILKYFTFMSATKKANVLFESIKPNMDKVLQHKATDLVVRIDAILEGLEFRFFIDTEDTQHNGLSYRRQFVTPDGVRADCPYVAEFMKALNLLTRRHVQEYLDETEQKRTFTKYRTCFKCQKQSDACQVCGRCKNIRYCGSECQLQDWKEHKKVCNK
jgi:hypothetical protein